MSMPGRVHGDAYVGGFGRSSEQQFSGGRRAAGGHGGRR